MSKIYESIITGLTEAVEDAKSAEKKLKRNTVTIAPFKSIMPQTYKKSVNLQVFPNSCLRVILVSQKKQ